MGRNFEDRPAVRTATPLLLGLVGPSGSGKTFSALRLATGIQRVSGGEVFFIDTEARRGLHYADRFRFRHLEFGAPFSPLDYLEAIEHCAKKGAKVIVVDSMSHEHEGPGGVLEQHAQLVKEKGEHRSFQLWAEPKAKRRRLINTLLQVPVHFLFAFRAKEKLRMRTEEEKARGLKEPEPLGFMPIAGEEFVYEMTAKFLLLPGVEGKPTWDPQFSGEKSMCKRPEQFKKLLAEARQLDEDLGEAMARWAAGTPAVDIDALLARYSAADRAGFDALEVERKAAWGQASAEQKKNLKLVSDATRERLAGAEAAPAVETTETAPAI